MNKIDELLAEVQKLREAQQPSRDAAFMEMENELREARYEANTMRAERDKMAAELAKVKADVAWKMDSLQIRDIIGMRGVEIPCAGEDWLPLDRDQKTPRALSG